MVMIKKDSKRIIITVDKKTLFILNHIKGNIKCTNTQLICSIVRAFYDNNLSIGYTDIWSLVDD